MKTSHKIIDNSSDDNNSDNDDVNEDVPDSAVTKQKKPKGQLIFYVIYIMFGMVG